MKDAYLSRLRAAAEAAGMRCHTEAVWANGAVYVTVCEVHFFAVAVEVTDAGYRIFLDREDPVVEVETTDVERVITEAGRW